MSDSGPEVTVIVPTVGRQAQLERCLSALRIQKGVQRLSVIVVHNHTRKIEDTTYGGDVRIRHIREPRISVGRARNTGLAAAQTPWVLYTDDDCVVPAHWVVERRAFVSSHPETVCIGGLISEPNTQGCINSFMHRLNYMGTARTMKMRPGNIPSMGCGNLAFRRDVLLTLGGFNERITSGEDYEILVRLREAGHSLALDYNGEPVKHMPVTDLRRFVSRYLWYGKGVAQIAMLHGLDWESHRIYLRDLNAAEIARAAHRFALEDLRNTRCHPGTPRLHLPAHVVLAYVRALSWQLGAFSQLRKGVNTRYE